MWRKVIQAKNYCDEQLCIPSYEKQRDIMTAQCEEPKRNTERIEMMQTRWEPCPCNPQISLISQQSE
jgi:hypothetical protein